MEEKIVEIGTVSARGQIAIPAELRRRLSLTDGERVLFAIEGNALIVKKFDNMKTWKEITRPLRNAMAKSHIMEKDSVNLVHRMRSSKRK